MLRNKELKKRAFINYDEILNERESNNLEKTHCAKRKNKNYYLPRKMCSQNIGGLIPLTISFIPVSCPPITKEKERE